MSGPPESRWSRGGPQQQRQNRPQSQTPSNSSANSNANNRHSMAGFSGNAWGAQERGRSQNGPGAERKSTPTPSQGPQGNKGSAPPASAGPTKGRDGHAPVKGFNSGEVKTFLGQTYKEAIAGCGSENPYIKIAGDSVPKRTSGVWSNKQTDSKNMANGQNFWAQLSQQLAKIEQAK